MAIEKEWPKDTFNIKKVGMQNKWTLSEQNCSCMVKLVNIASWFRPSLWRGELWVNTEVLVCFTVKIQSKLKPEGVRAQLYLNSILNNVLVNWVTTGTFINDLFLQYYQRKAMAIKREWLEDTHVNDPSLKIELNSILESKDAKFFEISMEDKIIKDVQLKQELLVNLENIRMMK